MLRNGAVEEYEPPAPEIRTHATSWYEPTPDRSSHPYPSPPPQATQSRRAGIILTDLDGSDADDGRDESVEPVILPSTLEMLQKRPGAPVLPRAANADDAQRLALVPFRPPMFRAPESLGFEDQAPAQRGIVEEEDGTGSAAAGMGRDGEAEVDGGALADEEDGMDVEPMDVEL